MNNAEGKPVEPKGLELFFAMYAVALVLGLEEVSKALYTKVVQQGPTPTSALHLGVTFGLCLAILLLIVRFFWSTGNIRRAVSRTKTVKHRQYLVIHLPVLLIQSVLVLFVCFSFVDYASAKVTGAWVQALFLLATLWNALWLCTLVGRKWEMPEALWLRNNFAFVAVGTILFIPNHFGYLSTDSTLLVFVIVSVLSSVLDLWTTAQTYLTESGH